MGRSRRARRVCSRATTGRTSATRAAFTPDGWLRMGDAGFIDARGHLVVIDRARDVGKLDNGEPFAPQFIENKLKFSPFIREAVAFGNARPFVAAMIAIDMATVGNWAEHRACLHELHGPGRQARNGRPDRCGTGPVQRDAAAPASRFAASCCWPRSSTPTTPR